MQKILISSFLFFGLTISAQENFSAVLKQFNTEKNYTQIIEQFASKSLNYSAQDLFYIGQAYFIKNDDVNCIKFMNLSIEKDKKNAGPAYYKKASSLNYLKKYDEAVQNFKSAIALDSLDAEFYSGLGDAFYNLEKKELAIEAYTKATEQSNPPDRPFSMIAQIYSDIKNNDRALAAFYTAKSKIDNTSKSYDNALYNIGLLESLKGNYDKAEVAFSELLQLSPADYQIYSKLIQIYYFRKEYDKAKSLKAKLYEAHQKNLLKNNLEDMFCFDQFKWNDKLIQAFERYEDSSKNVIYNKHLFYVVNKQDKIDFRIQTEYDRISVELGGAKYLLCMNKGNVHSTFNLGFNDDFKYDVLKKAIIDILEGKIKPIASSTTK